MSWFVGTQVPFFWVGFKNDFLFKRSAVTFKVCSLISWWSPFPVTTEVMSLGIWSRVFYTLSPINTLTAASECDDKWWLLCRVTSFMPPPSLSFFQGVFFFLVVHPLSGLLVIASLYYTDTIYNWACPLLVIPFIFMHCVMACWSQT